MKTIYPVIINKKCLFDFKVLLLFAQLKRHYSAFTGNDLFQILGSYLKRISYLCGFKI